MYRNSFSAATHRIYGFAFLFALISCLMIAALTVSAEEAVEGSDFPETFEELAEIYSFTVDGTAIHLPTTFDEMKTVGLSQDGYITSNKIRANTITGMELYNSEGAAMKIDVFGDEKKDVLKKEAKIIKIDVTKEAIDELGIDFTAAGGFRMGDSIYDVQKRYGGKVVEETPERLALSCRFTFLMAEKGCIDDSKILSPFFEDFTIHADQDGCINHIVLKYYKK